MATNDCKNTSVVSFSKNQGTFYTSKTEWEDAAKLQVFEMNIIKVPFINYSQATKKTKPLSKHFPFDSEVLKRKNILM